MTENDSPLARSVAESSGLAPAPVLLRAKQIAGPILPIGLSTWWLMVKQDRAPKGIKLSSRITVWKRDDILALVDRLGNTEAL